MLLNKLRLSFRVFLKKGFSKFGTSKTSGSWVYHSCLFNMGKMLKGFLNSFVSIFVSGYQMFRRSRLARILLIIVVVKFLVFFGLLKGFLYPRFLEPHYESEQQQS